MLENLFSKLADLLNMMGANAKLALYALLILWAIQIINYSLHYRLNILGLVPRSIKGIPGIIFSPFLHGSFTHLFFNSIPLFVLLDFMLMFGLSRCESLTLAVILMSGILLWFLGRNGRHVGASGLVMGYLSYLLVNAYQHPSLKSILLGVICLYYFSGLLLGLFPSEEKVSWEGHVFGFLAGIAAMFLVK